MDSHRTELLHWNEYVRSKELVLDKTAFMMAKTLQYPSLNIDEQLRIIDSMAAELKSFIDHRERPTEIITAMNEYIFEKQAFAGNVQDYYDPRNSYLNDVLAHKTGIPITLSVLYIELARRIGFKLHGVGFPGHFLIKYAEKDLEIVLDPFSKGRILAYEDYQVLLDQLYNGQIKFEKSFLNTVTNEQILIRMLRNLKDAFVYSYDYDKALMTTDMVLSIDQNIAEEFRDRGMIFYYKQLYENALSDLTKYLENKPDANDADNILAIIRDIKAILSQDMYK
ncbi:MAG: regulator of sirC expression with transglutaminase-like and TPR domain [Candidatus Nitrosomirales archaeon]|jgi:regulator of sirC expression with transglutaminase-like and TPR domain